MTYPSFKRFLVIADVLQTCFTIFSLPPIFFLLCIARKKYLTSLVAPLRINLIDRFTSLSYPPDILNQQICTYIKVPFYICARMRSDDDFRVRVQRVIV